MKDQIWNDLDTLAKYKNSKTPQDVVDRVLSYVDKGYISEADADAIGKFGSKVDQKVIDRLDSTINLNVPEQPKAEDKSFLTSVSEAVYPRLTDVPGEGSKTAALALDLMSLPGRIGSGIIESGQDVIQGEWPTPLENLKRTTAAREKQVIPSWLPQSVKDFGNKEVYDDATIFDIVKGGSNLTEDIQRNPFTIVPGVGRIGAALPSKFGQFMLERTPAIVQGAGRVAAEGAVVPAMMSVDRASKGIETTPQNIKDEAIFGGLLGLYPGAKQFARAEVDKSMGKKIIDNLNYGRTTPNPIVSENLVAEQTFRDNLKKYTSQYFDDNLSTVQNIKNIRENLYRIPEQNLGISKTNLENLFKSYNSKSPGMLPDLKDIGATVATGGTALPAVLARKVVQSPETIYARTSESAINPITLGRALYQTRADATRTQNNK